MTVDDVIAAASQQTGLSNIGDTAVLEGLKRLLEAYASEARFTQRGSQMAHADLVTFMSIRMKLDQRKPRLLGAAKR
jgi:HEAT repeat protein